MPQRQLQNVTGKCGVPRQDGSVRIGPDNAAQTTSGASALATTTGPFSPSFLEGASAAAAEGFDLVMSIKLMAAKVQQHKHFWPADLDQIADNAWSCRWSPKPRLPGTPSGDPGGGPGHAGERRRPEAGRRDDMALIERNGY